MAQSVTMADGPNGAPDVDAPPTATADGTSEKVSLGHKASWAVASISDQLVTNGIQTLALPIYNLSLHVDPRLLGWAMALPRILDAIIDPTIGNISDNTRTRWGRRRPFVLVGGILMALAFMFIWFPPLALGKTGLFVYFLLTSMVCYFGYAIFAIPRGAMGIEMSTDYHERTSIFAMNSFFAYIAVLTMPWLYNLSFRIGANELIGVRYVAVGTGIVILLCAIAPALFIRERTRDIQAQPKTRLFAAFRMTISNFPFLLLFCIVFLILLACSLVGPMNLYISIDYICGGNKEYGSYIGGISGTVGGLVGLCATPGIAWISRRIGKKQTMLIGQFIAMGGFIGSWWLFNPKYPYLQIVEGALVTIGLGCVWVLSGSLMADICDTDELKYGLRREGMFGAVFQFLTKTTSSCVTIVAGYVLVLSGYQESTVQSMDTLWNMRMAFIVITVSCLTLSIVLTCLFPITEKSARQVRAELDARKRDQDALAAQA